jgi:hypothetical protein
MDWHIYFIIFYVVMFLLMPFVPKMLRFRIRLLEKLHLYWFADFHRRHFEGFVTGVRAAMLLGMILGILIAFGFFEK